MFTNNINFKMQPRYFIENRFSVFTGKESNSSEIIIIIFEAAIIFAVLIICTRIYLRARRQSKKVESKSKLPNYSIKDFIWALLFSHFTLLFPEITKGSVEITFTFHFYNSKSSSTSPFLGVLSIGH